MRILTHLFAGAAGPAEPKTGELSSWLELQSECPFDGTIERAVWGGFRADRLGYAFAAGYGAAIKRLVAHARSQERVPSSDRARASIPPSDRNGNAVISFAATEGASAHPRSVATRLDKHGGALILRGEKSFATMAPLASEILVVASRGVASDGRNRLRVVRVRRGARGLVIEPREATPFTPEVPHARLRFEDVVVDDTDVLGGDGYDAWMRPFRTIEDAHVLAAVVGYVASVARRHRWEEAIVAELASFAFALVEVGNRDPDSPFAHVVLAGMSASLRRFLASLEAPWRAADEVEHTRWMRDLPLLDVAEGARAKRTEKAIRTLQGV